MKNATSPPLGMDMKKAVVKKALEAVNRAKDKFSIEA